jgi:hypothetical protein
MKPPPVRACHVYCLHCGRTLKRPSTMITGVHRSCARRARRLSPDALAAWIENIECERIKRAQDRVIRNATPPQPRQPG